MTAEVGCKFTVHFSTSFSTISLFAAIPQTKLPDSAVQMCRDTAVKSAPVRLDL